MYHMYSHIFKWYNDVNSSFTFYFVGTWNVVAFEVEAERFDSLS